MYIALVISSSPEIPVMIGIDHTPYNKPLAQGHIVQIQ